MPNIIFKKHLALKFKDKEEFSSMAVSHCLSCESFNKILVFLVCVHDEK